MDSGGHDVAGGQAVFHHVSVMFIGVSTVETVQVPGALVGCQHDAAAAAGVVRYSVSLQGLGVPPIKIFRYGQVGQ